MDKFSSYNYQQILERYKLLGIKKGDNLFVTTGLGFLGSCENIYNLDSLCAIHLEALQEILGSIGTIIVPTYSYTFGESTSQKLALFDVKNTLSKIGPFPNFVLREKSFKRSIDPMVSVSCSGPKTDEIIDDISNSSYGHNSVFERMLDHEIKCLSIGLGPNWTPFIHYLDYIVSSEYRYDKLFYGKIKFKESNIKKQIWNYSVPVRIENTRGNCQKLGYLAEKNGIWQSTNLGKGSIYLCKYRDYFNFAKDYIKYDNWCTAKGPKVNIFEGELKRIRSKKNFVARNLNYKDFSFNPEIKSIKPITGNSLESTYNLFESFLYETYIDYFKVKTGSNCGGYVVPEAWVPLNLTIKSQKQEEIFNTDDESIIRNLVIPHSKTISKISLDKFEDHTLDQLSNLIVESSYKPMFTLNTRNFCQLKKILKLNEKISFSLDVENSLSHMEVIALMPKNFNKIYEIIIIDSLIFDIRQKDLKTLIQNMILSGKIIIYGPTHFALHSFCKIYKLDPKECSFKFIYGDTLKSFRLRYGPNISCNKDNFFQNSIKFINT